MSRPLALVSQFCGVALLLAIFGSSSAVPADDTDKTEGKVAGILIDKYGELDHREGG